MPDPRYRVLAIATHRVQYMVPIFRRMATHPALDLQVAYCTLRGAEAAHDPEFGANIQWDVPLSTVTHGATSPTAAPAQNPFSGFSIPVSGASFTAEISTPSSVSRATSTPRSGSPASPRSFRKPFF